MEKKNGDLTRINLSERRTNLWLAGSSRALSSNKRSASIILNSPHTTCHMNIQIYLSMSIFWNKLIPHDSFRLDAKKMQESKEKRRRIDYAVYIPECYFLTVGHKRMLNLLLSHQTQNRAPNEYK